MKQYNLKHNNSQIEVHYTKGGILRKVIAKKGPLSLKELVDVIPDVENDIDDYTQMEPVLQGNDPLFTKMQNTWFEFYKYTTGLDYRFLAKDGAALKSICKHLTQLADGDQAQALEMWQYITRNWTKLEDFYRRKMELPFINSQLNTILNQLKNGKQAGKTAGSNTANDLRRGF